MFYNIYTWSAQTTPLISVLLCLRKSNLEILYFLKQSPFIDDVLCLIFIYTEVP